MKKIFLKSLFLTVIFVGIFSFFGLAFAQDLGLEVVAQTGLAGGDIRVIIANIIRTALGLLGLLAVIIVLWGGFVWMTAGGNEEKVATAKKILFNGVIGLMIILFSYAIVSFVISKLTDSIKPPLPAHCSNGVRDEDEEDTDCGGAVCSPCDKFWPTVKNLTITKTARPGDVCVANYYPTIGFSTFVDTTTVQDTIKIFKKNIDNTESIEAGTWEYVKIEGVEDKSQIIFYGGRNCGDNKNNCLEVDTNYVLKFVNPYNIKSLDGEKSLYCGALSEADPKYTCGQVNFKTGTKVDVESPVINMISLGDPLIQGYNVPVSLQVTDDVAVDRATINLIRDGQTSTPYSGTVSGCVTSTIVEVTWPTAGFSAGLYDLLATAYDLSDHSANTSTNIRLQPPTCADGKCSGDEDCMPPTSTPTAIDCGENSACGRCDNSKCRYNSDCASGICGKDGICISVMRIINISPKEGIAGNYLGIYGRIFGSTPGNVYLSNTSSPSSTVASDWVTSSVATCGGTAQWYKDQIVVEVPDGFDTSSAFLKVVSANPDSQTANTIGDGSDIYSMHPLYFSKDLSSDSAKKPSLCTIVNASGTTMGDIASYENTTFIGKNFGTYNSAVDKVRFTLSSAANDYSFLTVDSWGKNGLFDDIIAKTQRLDNGNVTAMVLANGGYESNSLRVNIKNNIDDTAPEIESVSPASGGKGQYVTIMGRNFGKNVGQVYFYKDTATTPPTPWEFFTGSFDFPTQCDGAVWNDNKILVKIPSSTSEVVGETTFPTIGVNYYIKIVKADTRTSLVRNDIRFLVSSTLPSPGICKLEPANGLIGTNVTAYGENFGTDLATSKLYFWTNSANNNNLTGRVSSVTDVLEYPKLTTKVPSGAVSGQVNIGISGVKKGNSLDFTVEDCTKNKTICNDTQQCCSGGADNGICKATTELCAGTTVSTGYMWRFTTRDFPIVPEVLVGCKDVDTNWKYSIPTPAPSLMWNGHNNTCINALVTIGINTTLATLDSNNLLVYSCAEGPANNGNVCQNINPTKLDYTLSRGTLSGSGTGIGEELLQISLAGNVNWADNTYYQVVLKSDIQSSDATRPQLLKKTNPCVYSDLGLTRENTAYCFVFKTGKDTCKLASVSVIPEDYWTGILESPIRERKDKRNNDEVTTEDLLYEALGKAEKDCLMMNINGYDFEWNSQRTLYADVPESSKNVVTAIATTTVNALGNTVAIGLTSPANAVLISATVSTTSVPAKTGSGSLKIDLSDPQITNYGPQCLSACPNADIFVDFDKQMSTNISSTAFVLKKCKNSACTETDPVALDNPTVIVNSGIFKLNLASGMFATNSYYKVEITSNTLFTIATTSNPNIQGKPYIKDFSWVFGTKDKVCEVNKVVITPPVYNAFYIGARTIFYGNPYSVPDSCDINGQLLNANNYNWQWTSDNHSVATTTDFAILGDNPFCNGICLPKGSTIASGTFDYAVPMCGNGILEAGEDCEIGVNSSGEYLMVTNPFTSDCSTKCLSKSKTKIGSCWFDDVWVDNCNFCNKEESEVNISEEDCALGIIGNPLVVSSSLNCSNKCLHTGTPLSAKWCDDNYELFHVDGVSSTMKNNFENACRQSVSQCGNGIQEPGESCDGGSACPYANCVTTTILKGSSLLATQPSVCGDGHDESGYEDTFCEDNLYNIKNNFIAPWVLVEATGYGSAVNTSIQTSKITGTETSSTKSGTADFNLVCGAKNDDECAGKKPTGVAGEYGVAYNSCCYPRPIISSTYPNDGDRGVCPNTQIKISFDRLIDIKTLPGNLLIARNYLTDSPFCTGTQKLDASEIAFENSLESLPWYKVAWKKVVNFVKNIFGFETATAVSGWCTGEVQAIPSLQFNGTTKTWDLTLSLAKGNMLAGNTATYTIIMRDGIKDTNGVSIGKEGTEPNKISHQFSFTTWDEKEECKINAVNIDPPTERFENTNDSKTFTANVLTATKQIIQPTLNYSWSYIWSKDQSLSFAVNTASVTDTTTVSALNQNGEGDVFVTVSTTDGGQVMGKSHITVFLCENPWPPFEVKKANGSFVDVWPFDDTVNNTDEFNFDYNPEITDTGFNGKSNDITTTTNFSTFYCADSGATGIKDDLPYMKPVVTSTVEADVLKYFLLTNDKNADAIGIKIFSNTNYLTLSQWMQEKGIGLGTFSSLKIDGYEAMVDQYYENVYISALNLNNNKDAIYSNIYLFSLSGWANTDVKEKIFKKMLENLKFNVDLDVNYNLKSCATSYAWQGAASPEIPVGICKTDLDCLGYPGSSVCLNQKEKMQRNYQRLQDMKVVSSSLSNYFRNSNSKYPSITGNTFLTGRAFSVWNNSWNEFGSENNLKMSLPVDPVNKLAPAGTCLKAVGTNCIQDEDCGDSTFGDIDIIGKWDAENTLTDASTKNVTTTKNGNVSFGDGMGSGKSFSFDGQESTYLTITSSSNYLDDTFAISFWFKPTPNSSSDLSWSSPAVLIKQGGWTEDATKNHSLGGFMVEYNKGYFNNTGYAKAANGTIRFAIFPNGSDDWYYAIDSQTPLSLDKWHHIVVSYNKTNKEQKLFIDGDLMGESEVRVGKPDRDGSHGSPDGKDRNGIGITSENVVVGQSLKGSMDKIYFYKANLTEDNVKEDLYKNVCQLHNPETGWSAEDMRFSFACGAGSMAYGYISSSTDKFSLRMTREDDNLDPNVWTGEVNAVNGVKTKLGLGNSSFIFSNFCESSIVSNNKGYCGDGILNYDEKCEPVGSIVYDTSPCPNNSTTYKICQNISGKCDWNPASFTTSCLSIIPGSCGDGITQKGRGEVCDDGENNGEPGFCWTNCQPTTTPVCGNGKLDVGEYCDTVSGKCIFDGVNVVYDNEKRPLFYMLFDESGSMRFTFDKDCDTNGKIYGTNTDCNYDIDNTRIKKIKDELPGILDKFYGKTRVGAAGFTTYNDPSLTDNPDCDLLINITDNINFNKNSINLTLQNELNPESGTPTGQALDYVYNNVLKSYQEKNPISPVHLILFTDGDAEVCGSDSGEICVKNKIEFLKKQGIIMHILGVGVDKTSFHTWAEVAGTSFVYVDKNSELDNIITPLIGDQSCQEYSFYSGYSCSWNCKGQGGYCGDNIKNGPEECDDGTANGPGKKCDSFCNINESVIPESDPVVPPECGNGEVQIEKGETCDMGKLTGNGVECKIKTGNEMCTWCNSYCQSIDKRCPLGQVANSNGVCTLVFVDPPPLTGGITTLSCPTGYYLMNGKCKFNLFYTFP